MDDMTILCFAVVLSGSACIPFDFTNKPVWKGQANQYSLELSFEGWRQPFIEDWQCNI